ncbi:hypothetical protein A3F00_02320 [Candidatus Daviesbacteria bacterium RIFCSPHIGHO2_12_FULL_37_11]|uniref:Glycosyltransferase RgtA/B/C/D-like domain-containing protein n=1 Tax=Candidatus Daviesbacteria bacterium RIFCSPHIGHO2_12_FULL_37_11 TaxID=1797777 RepID=A0A1F5K8G2_9BACT|nr:MAG: hypothetical protein A2769_00165 [Candidatus Daviesbacteria bacterium RIFCSPHIGHO2_01_FULL_37_27]OGE37217.1 MAG: hypothetical protein A3F00_02320 [Candidatus Daviesbacteria bacterium RIFCSPHIGHO2_12_FULL_37_11]OGE46091.1 MAG: hypothetical protein A3B39_00775 [Candidatus Daviesbacteria bacterium RIFCSPLOWO2_01_FULL_37_10]
MKNNLRSINFNTKYQAMLIMIVIIILAAVLRLIVLDKYPAGLNADEAAIGYNAYSLLQTGKDEYGTPFPLSFKSFGDYKPGLYFYLVMPFVAILGLNEWAVRIPSALFGIGTVILIYFLAKEIFKNRWVGIFSSLLLAISPWHIHFSRGGWETNAATFFMALGIFLFTKSLESFKLIWWSLLAFLMSMYIYQSPRLIIPVLLLALVFIYRERINSMIRIIETREAIASIIILIFLTIPLIMQFTSGGASERFQGLSFLADSGPSSRVNELRGEHTNPGSLAVLFLHNKLTSYVPEFLGNYLDHFKGNFLFINGDPLIRNKIPDVGQFYLIEALFLFAGLFILVKQKNPHTKLLASWIMIAPLASSMTYQTPHALRALNMVVPLSLVMGYGLWNIGNWLKRFVNITFIIIITTITVILSFEFIHYLESYYIHYPKRYPLAWEYGFSEMVTKLNKYESAYENVVITDRYDQPYILVLFYKKYDPEKYQPQAVLSPRDKFNFGTVRGFDKYKFHSINEEELKNAKDTLFIGAEQEIPETSKIIDKIFFPDGKIAFVFAET